MTTRETLYEIYQFKNKLVCFVKDGIPVKLFNIKPLENDFNFMDIEADWIDFDLTQKHGKFYIKDLIIK